MKIHLPFLAIIIFPLFQLTFSSCKSDDDQQHGDFTENYQCITADTITEVFTVLEDPPVYGSNETDLSDYIISSIEIANLELIKNGEIALRLIIFDTGEPCLSNVIGKNTPKASLLGHDSLINDMSFWAPGKQRDTPRHSYAWITIKILDGEIESIN